MNARPPFQRAQVPVPATIRKATIVSVLATIAFFVGMPLLLILLVKALS